MYTAGRRFVGKAVWDDWRLRNVLSLPSMHSTPAVVHSFRIALAALCLIVAACGTLPRTPTSGPSPDPQVQAAAAETVGAEIAIRAIALVGIPYRYGGADLDGFDCSGLVYFIHQQLGIGVPRTAADQQRAAQHIKRGEAAPGDLLFFHTRGRGVSHVGIYVGENRFVHAPQSGRLIELRAIDDSYYGPRLVSVGRLRPVTSAAAL